MNDKPAIESDSTLVAALMRLVDVERRHQLLTELSERVATDVLVSAAEAGNSRIPIPMGEDGVDSRELVESFLQAVRPQHAAHDYLDDYWAFIWEDAWPEGVADAVLGSVEFDRHAAADLMEAIDRRADEIGLAEPPPFDADDMEAFVKEWRARAIEELAKLKGST